MSMLTNSYPGARQSGAALGAVLHALLLLLVLAQVVYLASRYHVRIDTTSDRLWTTTESTARVLDRLEERLLIEAFFSPKDALPVQFRVYRDLADNFLDELVQRGDGRVVLVRKDPNSDKSIADEAVRLGIEPLKLRSASATSLSVDQHWQGLRLRYGGDRQQVVASFLPDRSFAAEARLTPAIKEVLTVEKRRIGYMEWPAQRIGGQRPGGIGWKAARTHQGIEARYEFQNFKDEDGALLPDDVDTLFLFRPKELTDRQKYVIDQFVVRGGTLVVFADAAEYAVGPNRVMIRLPFSLDASGSEVTFQEQLRHYGIEWRPQLVCDMAEQARRTPLTMQREYFSVPIRTPLGGVDYRPVDYPYFFHAVAGDWSQVADALATDASGNVDQRKAEQYRQVMQPGIPGEEFLFQSFRRLGRGPGFYWPTWTGLRRSAGGAADLPEGVEGRVLLWSSPYALVEDPPANLDPVGRDPTQMKAQSDQFFAKRQERLRAEVRQQVPLMAEVRGRMTSAFGGRAVPLRPSQAAERDAARDDGGVDDAASGGDDANSDPAAAGPLPAKADADPDAADATPVEPAMLVEGEAPGRVIVIGDATFLRDDLMLGEYEQIGGPVSGRRAMPFFAQLLDWMAEDRDLAELQSRIATDRSLVLLETNEIGTDRATAEQALSDKTRLLVVANVALPVLLLLCIGAVVWSMRSGQKRRFLAALNR